MKPHNRGGLAGCVATFKSRATGTRVGVYATAEAGFDNMEDAWMSLCEEHHEFVTHATIRQAMRARDPREWCEECRASKGASE